MVASDPITSLIGENQMEKKREMTWKLRLSGSLLGLGLNVGYSLNSLKEIIEGTTVGL